MGDNRLKARPRRQLRQVTLVLGVCLVLYCLFFLSNTPAKFGDESRTSQAKPSSRHPPSELLNNLSLGEDECDAAFPGLTKEIDDTVAEGPFRVKQTGDGGPVQGRIRDGQVCCFSVATQCTIQADSHDLDNHNPRPAQE